MITGILGYLAEKQSAHNDLLNKPMVNLLNTYKSSHLLSETPAKSASGRACQTRTIADASANVSSLSGDRLPVINHKQKSKSKKSLSGQQAGLQNAVVIDTYVSLSASSLSASTHSLTLQDTTSLGMSETKFNENFSHSIEAQQIFSSQEQGFLTPFWKKIAIAGTGLAVAGIIVAKVVRKDKGGCTVM